MWVDFSTCPTLARRTYTVIFAGFLFNLSDFQVSSVDGVCQLSRVMKKETREF